MKLKVSLNSDSNLPGRHQYSNQVNADNYKDVCQILLDLANFGIPIDKALKEYNRLRNSDWDTIIGS